MEQLASFHSEAQELLPPGFPTLLVGSSDLKHGCRRWIGAGGRHAVLLLIQLSGSSFGLRVGAAVLCCDTCCGKRSGLGPQNPAITAAEGARHALHPSLG